MSQSLELSAINYCNLLISAHHYAIREINQTLSSTHHRTWLKIPIFICMLLELTGEAERLPHLGQSNTKQIQTTDLLVDLWTTAKNMWFSWNRRNFDLGWAWEHGENCDKSHHSLKLIWGWRMECEYRGVWRTQLGHSLTFILWPLCLCPLSCHLRNVCLFVWNSITNIVITAAMFRSVRGKLTDSHKTNSSIFCILWLTSGLILTGIVLMIGGGIHVKYLNSF